MEFEVFPALLAQKPESAKSKKKKKLHITMGDPQVIFVLKKLR